MTKKNRAQLEWTIIFLALVAVIIVKYFMHGCIIVCGDWYDE